MPSPKEVRAAQNRQKERVAAQLVERKRLQKRRRIVGSNLGVMAFAGLVAIVYAIGNNNSGSNEGVKVVPTSAPPQDSTTTTVALKSVKGKPCVGLKDPLPKGAPPMLLSPGPAPTKLIMQDLKVGTGAVVPANAKVTMNYIGVACSTGKIFDSTYAHNQTFPADLSSSGNLIKGWQQGIPGMKVGGVRILAIPSDLGYGAGGNPPAIAPDEALYFLVSAEKLN
jgi:peptidylprolyl isomerase